MARSHGVLKVEIWEARSDFRRLDIDGQWAYAMLISQPQINNLGVLPYVPEKWWRLAADLTRQRLDQMLVSLEQQRYTITDADTAELLVRTFIKHDAVWKQPKLVTNARRLVREVESELIRNYLIDRHPWLTDETWTPEKIGKHENAKRAPETPIDTPTERGSDTPIAQPVENTADEARETPIERGIASRARAQDDLPLPQDQPLPPPSTSKGFPDAARANDEQPSDELTPLDYLAALEFPEHIP